MTRVRSALFDVKTYLAVVEQQVGADLKRREDFRVQQRSVVDITGRGIEVEPESSAGLKPYRPLGERAHAQLGALAAAAEVEAKHIDAGVK